MKFDLEKLYKSKEIRALIQLIPAGGAIDIYINDVITRLRQQRARLFFDDLSNGNVSMYEDQIQNDEFIHAYLCTLQAVIRTQSSEKILMFAGLFKKYAKEKTFSHLDEFEGWLKLLDDVTAAEIGVCRILQKHESWTEQKNYSRPTDPRNYWRTYLEECEEVLELNRSGVLMTLRFAQRNQLVESWTLTHGGGGTDELVLTETYVDFAEALDEKLES